MKAYFKGILVLLVLFAGFSCVPEVSQNNGLVFFEETAKDFGILEYEADGDCSFKFTNSGEFPLIILNVKTSCGCTVAEWVKKPIKPGKTGEICIEYDTKYPGKFTKTISVYYNGKDSPQKLTIKGRVEYPIEKNTKL